MIKIKRFLLSKKVVLTLLSLIIMALLLSVFIPQRFTAAPAELEKWKQHYPFLNDWLQRIGMDHVYTTPWFAVILLLFIVSMALSAYDQIETAWKLTFSWPSHAVQSGAKSLKPIEQIRAVCRKSGYIQTGNTSDTAIFIRHPWGYWGNSLLHVGMVLVLVASLWIVMTHKRGLLNMFEGAEHKPAEGWQTEENGLMAGRFVLPDILTLERVIPEFHPNYRMKQLSTELSFIDEDNNISRHTLSVNGMLRYRGLDVYQSLNFGHAFFLLFTDESGPDYGSIIQIWHPESLEQPSYGDFKLAWSPLLLQAKYYADVNKKSIDSTEPQLFLRLMDGDKELGQLPLLTGEKGQLGPYRVTLVKVVKWAGIIFVDMQGMTLIFIGFAIIILGGGLNYFTPPRKLIAVKAGDACILHWQASKFQEFYAGEKEKILRELSGEMNNE